MNNNIIVDHLDLVNCSDKLVIPRIRMIDLQQPLYIRSDYYMYNAIPIDSNLTVSDYKEYINYTLKVFESLIVSDVPLLKRCLDTCSFLLYDDNMKSQLGVYYDYIKSVSSRFSLYLKYIYSRRDFYRNISRGFSLGDIGERNTSVALDLDDRFLQTGDLTLKYNDRVSQIDNVVVTATGVFVCEVKNIGSLSNSTLYIDSTGRWYIIHSDGRSVPVNATSQNSKHTSLVSNILLSDRRTCNVVPVSVFVIANDNIRVINKCSFINICRISGLRDLLLSIGNTSLDNNTKLVVGELLSKYSVKERVITFKNEPNLDLSNINIIKEQVNIFRFYLDKYYPFGTTI